MAKLVGTVARVNPKTGIWEHQHEGGSGWHWACAGHRDAGEIHAAAKATEPKFAEGTKEEFKVSYLPTVQRKEGFVSKIASAKTGQAVHVKADARKG